LCASYLNPASLLNITPEIVDRLCNAYRRDLPRKVDFVYEIERWKIGWALVDLLIRQRDYTLHATNRDFYIISILLTIPVSSTTSERSFSAMRRVKSYIRSTIGDERVSNLSHMLTFASRFGFDY